MARDLTVEILKQIRDGISSMHQDFNQRFDSLRQEFVELRSDVNERLDETNRRLDQTNTRLERVEQGLSDLGNFMRGIAGDQARHESFHTHHVDLLEQDVKDLKERLLRVEQHVGIPK